MTTKPNPRSLGEMYNAHVVEWIGHQCLRFADALAGGGEIVMHPDTWAEMKAGVNDPLLAAILKLVGREVRVIGNRLVPPGEMYAIPKPPPMRFGFVDVEMPR